MTQPDDEQRARMAEHFRDYMAAIQVAPGQVEAVARAVTEASRAMASLVDLANALQRQYGNLDKPPRRSRVGWSKRKRKRARRRVTERP